MLVEQYTITVPIDRAFRAPGRDMYLFAFFDNIFKFQHIISVTAISAIYYFFFEKISYDTILFRRCIVFP